MKIIHALAGMTIVGSVIAVAPQLASAHVPKISVTCQTGINVDLTKYHGTDDHVTIWKDGNVIADTDFTGEYHFQRGFTRTVSHTWRVQVVAPGEASPDLSGTVEPCVEATTTSVATDVPPVPTTTLVELPTPSTPTTAPEIACVLGPDGHYNFAGTNNPCEGPTITTPSALLIPPATPATVTDSTGSLPVTGSASTSLILLAAILVGFGVIATVTVRRR